MKPIVDPEGVEVSHLLTSCQFIGKKIVEIGCGHGSLTFQYADVTNLVVALDPAYSELILARNDRPPSTRNLSFLCAKGEELPIPAQFCDIALFASSL
jgi:ubiquinone/menaquinone biosynthesis C-methylase UbiE